MPRQLFSGVSPGIWHWQKKTAHINNAFGRTSTSMAKKRGLNDAKVVAFGASKVYLRKKLAKWSPAQSQSLTVSISHSESLSLTLSFSLSLTLSLSLSLIYAASLRLSVLCWGSGCDCGCGSATVATLLMLAFIWINWNFWFHRAATAKNSWKLSRLTDFYTDTCS